MVDLDMDKYVLVDMYKLMSWKGGLLRGALHPGAYYYYYHHYY